MPNGIFRQGLARFWSTVFGAASGRRPEGVRGPAGHFSDECFPAILALHLGCDEWFQGLLTIG